MHHDINDPAAVLSKNHAIIVTISLSIAAVVLFCCLKCRIRSDNNYDLRRQQTFQLSDFIVRESVGDEDHEDESFGSEASSTRTNSYECLSQIHKLEKIYNEVALNTVHVYFELKIVDNTTWYLFIDERLHELFHCFKPRTTCCKDKSPLPSMKIFEKVSKEQFNLLYEADLSKTVHEVKNSRGFITQHCLCPFSPKATTSVTSLDITLMCVLMETCRRTPAGNPQWLKDIRSIRNKLFHRGEKATLSEQEVNECYQKLKDALVNIAGTIGEAFRNGVERRISDLDKRHSKIDDIKKIIVTQNSVLKQELKRVLENLNVNTEGVCFRSRDPKVLRKRPVLSSSVVDTMSTKDPKRIIIEWKFYEDGRWDVGKIQQSLNRIKTIGDFTIEFVYKGCLCVQTTADVCLLSDLGTFREAVEEFLMLFVKLLKLSEANDFSMDVVISVWCPGKHMYSDKRVKGASSRLTTSVPEHKITSLPSSPVEDRLKEAHVTPINQKIGVLEKGNYNTKIQPTFQSQKLLEVMYHKATSARDMQIGSSAFIWSSERDTKIQLTFQHQKLLDSVSTTYKKVPIKQSQLLRKPVFVKHINISWGHFDSCTTFDETFVITDASRGLILCDVNNKNLQHVPLSMTSRCVTAIDDTTVAVGMNDKAIQIFDVINSKTIRTLHTEGHINGLAYNDGYLYVGFYVVGIQVMDLQGKVIRRIQHVQTNPYNVTVHNNCILHTDCNNNLFCSSLSGKKLWQCEISIISAIEGLTTDDKGYIYAAGRFSNNVVVISPDVKQFGQLLSYADGLNYPRGICYNRKLNTLMVCNRNGPAFLYKIHQ